MGLVDGFRREGFAVVENVLPPQEVEALLCQIGFEQSGATHMRGGKAYANREALKLEPIRELALSPHVRSLASGALCGEAFAVRTILFDKVPGANWKVPWHQDLTIAVQERQDVAGYGPWSIKEGIPHVQPPDHILENMVALRLHLDPCGPENGPLRVIPRTHLRGRLDANDVDRRVQERNQVCMTCNRGDAILMRPLLLHASSPSQCPEHRRVVHIEYAACELDAPLEWAHRM